MSKKQWNRTCWVASQLALFDNIPEEYKGLWKRIEGRHPDVVDEDGTIIEPANCSRYEDAKRLREKRLNVNRFLCANCDERHYCDYMNQFRDTTYHWFIQQKTFLYKAEDFISNFDTVVFDEDIMANFIEDISVTAHDVSVLLEYVNTLIEDAESYGVEDIGGYVNLQLVLSALENMLCRDPPRKPITGDILHRRLDEVCIEQHSRTLRELLSGTGPDQYAIIDKIHFKVNDKEKELPLDFVDSLLRILNFELFEKSEDSNLSCIELRRRKRKSRKDSPGNESPRAAYESVLRLYFKIAMPQFKKPVIVLDATGRPENYSALLERDIELFDVGYKFRNEVIQTFSSASNISAMMNKTHLKKMFTALESFIEEEPRTLVVGKKTFGPQIRAMLPPQAAFTHFFGNRGSNVFKGFKQVIVFGAPGFPMETVLMYASCMYYDRNLSTDTVLTPRTYTGTNRAVNVFCFAEPLIQNILEVSREDETYQALNRGRLVLDPSIRLILLTNIVIDQIPVTKLLSLDDIAGRKPDSGKIARSNIVRKLIDRQLNTIGFISTARTIRPFLESGVRVSNNEYRRKKPHRPKLGPYEEKLKEMVEANEKLPRREKRTATSLYEQLQGYGYTGAVNSVQRYVKRWREEHGDAVAGGVYIPLVFAPGDAMQFDWSHEVARIGGVDTMVKVAQMRLCHSRLCLVQAFPLGRQEMMLEGIPFASCVPFLLMGNKFRIEQSVAKCSKNGGIL